MHPVHIHAQSVLSPEERNTCPWRIFGKSGHHFVTISATNHFGHQHGPGNFRPKMPQDAPRRSKRARTLRSPVPKHCYRCPGSWFEGILVYLGRCVCVCGGFSPKIKSNGFPCHKKVWVFLKCSHIFAYGRLYSAGWRQDAPR